MVDVAEVMAELEEAGTAQTRKIYARHGVTTPMFGVPYSVLRPLQKRLGVDHDLALALWATGNHDARVVACEVVDRQRITAKLADAWVRDADCYVIAGAVAGAVAGSPVARSRSDAWRDRRGEWVASAGWGIVAGTAEDPVIWTVPELRALLRQIEAEIHTRPHRVRHEMNGALIVIALRNGNLRRQAIAIANRLGPLEVDHGETGCTTPDAVPYIERTLAHRARRAS